MAPKPARCDCDKHRVLRYEPDRQKILRHMGTGTFGAGGRKDTKVDNTGW
jgi:hypothetical protein